MIVWVFAGGKVLSKYVDLPWLVVDLHGVQTVAA